MNNSVIEEQRATTDTYVEEAIQELPNTTLALNGTLTSVPVLTKSKGKRGRPLQHDFSSRVYLVKKELEQALSDKEAFIELMHKTYKLSDERKEKLGSILDTPNELNFTIHGEIRSVIDQLHKLLAIYGDKATVRISKERLLNPGHALYIAPQREVIGERKGKIVYKNLFEEYRCDSLYGYVTVKL